MPAPSANDATPYCFLATREYVLRTPMGIEASEKTFDIPFYDFAKNYNLQIWLKLASAIFSDPSRAARLGPKQNLTNIVAVYLAAFSDNNEEFTLRRDYLENNGLVRLLILDDKLRTEVRQLLDAAALS